MTQHLKKGDLINVSGGHIHFNDISTSPETSVPKVLLIELLNDKNLEDPENAENALATLFDEKDFKNRTFFLKYMNSNHVYNSADYKEYTVSIFIKEMSEKYPDLTIRYAYQ